MASGQLPGRKTIRAGLQAKGSGSVGSAFEAEGGIRITPDDQKGLIKIINDFQRGLSTQERARIGSGMGKVLTDFQRTMKMADKKGSTLRIQDLEDLRAGVVEAGKIAIEYSFHLLQGG